MSYHEQSARIHDLEGLLRAAQVRAEEAEGRIDWLLGEIDTRDERICDIEAQCAAMREVLERFFNTWTSHLSGCECLSCRDKRLVIKALEVDAGAALLERLRKTEAENAGPINDLAQQLTMVVLKYELLVGLLVEAGEEPAEYGLTWPQDHGNEWINAPLEKAWHKALDYAISQRFVKE